MSDCRFGVSPVNYPDPDPGHTTDQSNWSGPFSLEVVMPSQESRGSGFKSQSGHSTGIFSLHVYFFSYYIW